MFGYSEHELSGGVAYILCAPQPGVLHVIRYMTFFVLQLKVCLGLGSVIGFFSWVVLSAKHLVSNRGHTMQALQQCLIGFLKFCRVLLNMEYG